MFDYEYQLVQPSMFPMNEVPIDYPKAEYRNLTCPLCHNYILEIEFTSALSYKEYENSGICNQCQKQFFKTI